MYKEKLEKFYNEKHKKLLIVPLVLFVLCFLILGYSLGTKGYILEKDVSLKGGVSATVYTSEVINEAELEAMFEGHDVSVRELSDFSTSGLLGYIIEIADLTNDEVQPVLEEFFGFEFTSDNYSVQETGSSLGAAFFREMVYAILFAFLLMAVVVFIAFRKVVPSLAVILSASLDLLGALAFVSLFEIKISSAGIAAFLLVLGYSIDTDVLLTTKVLKRKEGTIFERTFNAMKTGLTMTVTTIAALSVAFLLSNSLVLKEMFIIIIFALFVDIISTWLMNAPLLSWYVDKKNEKTV